MKKAIFVLNMLLSISTSFAQQSTINFEKNTTLEKVIEKANSLNKNIFIFFYDNFGDEKIKPFGLADLEKNGVPEFYNANFINLKIPLDTSNKECNEHPSLVNMGIEMKEKYKFNTSPIFMFFNANGEPLHRINGSGNNMLNKGKEALNPAKQYYTIKNKLDIKSTDTSILFAAFKAAIIAGDDDFMQQVGWAYFDAQKDFYTKQNINYFRNLTKTANDRSAKIMSTDGSKVDSVLGKGSSFNIMKFVVLFKDIMPFIIQQWDNTKWEELEKKLEKDYPFISKQMILFAKCYDASFKQRWTNYIPAVENYINSFQNSIPNYDYTEFANNILLKFDSIAILRKGLVWAEKGMEKCDMALGIEVYASLLHKLKRKKEALIWMQKAKLLAIKNGYEIEKYTTLIAKIKKGEPTW